MREFQTLSAVVLALGLISTPVLAAKAPMKAPAKPAMAKPAVKPVAVKPAAAAAPAAAKTAASAPAAVASATPAPVAPVAAAKAKYSTTDTDIGTLIDTPETKAALEKIFPGFSSNDQVAMARPMTLQAIKQYAPDQFTDAKLAALDEELAKIK
jgi:hypothetical protein